MPKPAQLADYERLISLLDELRAEVSHLRERTRFEVLTTLNTTEQLLVQAAYDDAPILTSAEDQGMRDNCICGHYADWHFLTAIEKFFCQATDCRCRDFKPATTPTAHIDGRITERTDG